MRQEIARLARHILPTVVTYAVASGWIPPQLQQPLIEAGIAIGAVIVAIFASKSAAKKQN